MANSPLKINNNILIRDDWVCNSIFSDISNLSRCSLENEGKTVYFIRHGESTANICKDKHKKDNDPMYRDAFLTDNGILQANNLQDTVKNWKIDLFIVSPFRRTMQTFNYAFKNFLNIDNIPITIAPVVGEFYTQYQECKGRNYKDLINDEKLNSLDLFKYLKQSLKYLNDEWWNEVGNDQRRLSHFTHFIHNCPYNNICVITHWGFIHGLFTYNPKNSINYSPSNCEWIYSIWKRNGDIYKHFQENENYRQSLLDLNSDIQKYLLLINTSNRNILPYNINANLYIQKQLLYNTNNTYQLCLLPGGNRKKNGLLNEIIQLQSNICKISPIISNNYTNKWFFVPLTKRFTISSQDQLDNLILLLKEWRDYITNNHVYWKITTPNIELNVLRCENSGLVKKISLGFKSNTITHQILSKLKSDVKWIDNNNIIDTLDCCIFDLSDANEENIIQFNNTLKSYPCIYGAETGSVYYAWDYLFKNLTWRLCINSLDNQNNFTWESGTSFPLW